MPALTFNHLTHRRVDLFAVDVPAKQIHLGFRLAFYLFGVTVDSVDRPVVKAQPLYDLDLEGHARVALASRRDRVSLARVLVEDSERGAYARELHVARGSQDTYGELFYGYRLRDPDTNHTWLTFGVTRRGEYSLTPVFKYTPPGAPCPPR